MKNKFNKQIKIKKAEKNYGFGLVDAIISMSLLVGVITYGIYFSSLRLSTVYDSNLIRSINKEIDRDIERLKSDLWSMDFIESQGKYSLSGSECEDFTEKIISLESWNVNNNSRNSMIQSWRPDAKRSKIFTGESVLITRELEVNSPFRYQSLNKSIATIGYRVEWGDKNIHWLSISLGPEAHSWCEQLI
ncbi:hypothetical protein [Prochlorococcus sp. MIT 1307]|uniref:hypothetical protein n=1 Tax=Prochlorococcus sp. MIT 1307 TaxID=3096219 RepID=UPI002A763340|nr:hypothetical protein [Prochlorococcus sp. MIT 1307]